MDDQNQNPEVQQPQNPPPTSLTPPPQQPQLPTAEPVITNPQTPSIKPSKSRKKILWSLIVLIVLVVVGLGAWYWHKHLNAKSSSIGSTTASSSKTSTTSSQKTATQPTATYSSVLVFQPSINSSSSKTSIIGLDGSKLANFSSSANDSTYDSSGYSMENLKLLEGSALITVDKSWSTFAVLTPDGKTTATASSLAPLLASNAHPNSANTLLYGITTGSNTLLALESSSNSKSLRLVKVNLVSGAVVTLLTAKSTQSNTGPGYTPLSLLTTSLNDNTVYLISNNASINSSSAAGVSLITYNLSTGKFTLKSLPSALDPKDAAVSQDGSIVAYQTETDSNGYGIVSTHIFNVQTGKDVTTSSRGLLTNDGAQDLRFSADGKYLSEVGGYAANTNKNGMELQIISTSSGTVSHQVDLEGTQYEGYGIVGFGWTTDDNFIYATNSSKTGTFNNAKEAVHSFDALTGGTYNYSQSFGELVAVLNYHD